MSPPTLQALLVEDSASDAELLAYKLAARGDTRVRLTRAVRLSEAFQLLNERHFDLMLLDLSPPDTQGLEALERVQHAQPGLPVVVLTGLADARLARETLRQGAEDYIIKDQMDGRGLLRSLVYAVERSQVRQESVRLRREAEEMDRRRAEFLDGRVSAGGAQADAGGSYPTSARMKPATTAAKVPPIKPITTAKV